MHTIVYSSMPCITMLSYFLPPLLTARDPRKELLVKKCRKAVEKAAIQIAALNRIADSRTADASGRLS